MSDNVIKLVPLHDLPEESRLIVKCAADIKPEKIDWLWEQRLPLGKCVLVAGEGGLGKSMLLAWIASAVSRGKEWPCGEGNSRRGSVVILSAEDDAADTIIPRPIAADAECTKVHILEAVRREDDEGHRSFNLQLDLPELERKISEIGDVMLVIIDPITSYLGKVDSHKNAELRSVLEPLGKMASRQHVTVIANTHLSKATVGNANSRVIGSVAFVNHARAAFIVTADPEDSGRRLFLPSKTNLGKPREGLAYRIADTALPGPEGSVIWAPFVQWEPAPVSISADEAMAAATGGLEGKSALNEARQFLMELLADGALPQKEIKAAAEGSGLSWATVRRAKGLLGIKPLKLGMEEGWVWELPKVLKSYEGAQASKMSIFGTNEHLRRAGLEEFEERAAIREYDGGFNRREAEKLAAQDFPDFPRFSDGTAKWHLSLKLEAPTNAFRGRTSRHSAPDCRSPPRPHARKFQ